MFTDVLLSRSANQGLQNHTTKYLISNTFQNTILCAREIDQHKNLYIRTCFESTASLGSLIYCVERGIYVVSRFFREG